MELDLDDPVVARASVHHVLHERSLLVVYQPIMDHRRHAIFGYEALTRPVVDGQMLPPDRWFRAAYENRRAYAADLLALTCIAHDVAALPDLGRSQPLFVNVMPSTLRHPSLLTRLARLVGQGLIVPEQWVFEITEHIPYDPLTLVEPIRWLTALGFRVAVDDFGTPGLGLDVIRDLEPTWVKIDRSRIAGLAASPAQRHWVRALVRHTGAEGATLIAEGVEDPRDVIALRRLGISLSQGFHWAVPRPGDQLVVGSDDTDRPPTGAGAPTVRASLLGRPPRALVGSDPLIRRP